MKIVGNSLGTHWEHTWNTMVRTTQVMHAWFEIQGFLHHKTLFVHIQNLSDGNVQIWKTSVFIE